MVCYGWTIDYINENITIPQAWLLLKEIKQNPPFEMVGFGLGEKNQENKLLQQVASLGDKVKYDKYMNKNNIKSVIRLKDKVKIK